MDERTGEIGGTPEVKDVFSVEVATAWEQAFFSADVGLVRRAAMRTGIVLGNEPDTVFQVLRRLTRMGLGGTMGHGRQYVSWIHERDFCRAVEFLIGRDDLDGPVNIVAPNPVANAEMMRLFREVLHVRLGVPATRWMLEIGAFLMRTETELILKSRRVVPLRLQEAGFQFEYPKLQPALKELSDRASKTSVPPQKAAHR